MHKELDRIAELDKDEFFIRVEDTIAHTYHVYIGGDIVEAQKYATICHLLRTATVNDTILIYWTSWGGSCHTGDQLANAMRGSAAYILNIVDCPCYSMASVLVLCGNSLVLNPRSMLHFHNYSSIEVGKGQELMDSAINHDRWLREQLMSLTQPFLSRGEVNQIMRDKDIWIHWDDRDLEKRIQRHFKKRQV